MPTWHPASKQIFKAAVMVAFAVSVGVAHARGTGAEAEGMANETPKQLENVGITEHLGQKIDKNLQFRNEAGETVTLGKYFSSHKPVLLTLAYFSCPSLCNFHLNGLNTAFKQMNWTIGKEYDVIVVSIEPKETPVLATQKKASYIKAYGRPEGAQGWHFLTGEESQIKALANTVGFSYHWDEEQQQYAHASAAYVLTPDGEISRYLYGIDFAPQTVRLSLVEASNGVIGNFVDQMILFCFHYDPKASKYSPAVMNIVRVAGLMVVGILIAFLFPFWVRSRREFKGLQGELK